MSYLDRLKEANSEKRAPSLLSKLPKAPFGTFGSTEGVRFREIDAVGVADSPPVSRYWLIHFAELNPVELYYTVPAASADVIGWHPDAIAAEPFEPPRRPPPDPMTAAYQTAIMAWLSHIEEFDPAIISDVQQQCDTDADARNYFILRANGISTHANIDHGQSACLTGQHKP